MVWSDTYWSWYNTNHKTTAPPATGPDFEVQYGDTYADDTGIVLLIGRINSFSTYTFSYAITNGSGTVVAGPFTTTLVTGPVSNAYALPGVSVPNASNYYGFIVYEGTYGTGYPAYNPSAGITVFHSSLPAATQTSPTSGAQVSTTTPTFVFGFSDSDPEIWGTFSAYQLQVQTASDATSMWDTGTKAATSAQKTAKAVSLVYGSFGSATALTNNTQYQWRVRVQNGVGTWSNYTPWRTFTPSIGPGAPTDITPSGLTNSLTPTISGTYVQANGGTESDFEYVIYQNAVQVYASDWITTAIATGSAYGGSPALSWGTSYTVKVRSKDSDGAIGPWSDLIAFNTNAAPTAPTNVTPGGGSIVGTNKPTITWTHNDADGDAQTKATISLYDTTAAAFVSGFPLELTQATASYTLTTALTLNHAFELKVKTQGTSGPGYGPYSDTQTFTYSSVPTLSMTAPAADDVITTPSFAVTWTFSGGSGTQQSYRVVVYADDGSTVVYDSGTVSGTVLTATVPSGKITNGNDYFVQLTVTDTLSQSAITSKVAVSVAYTLPDTITGLAAVAIGDQS